jgi:hypothetical protein
MEIWANDKKEKLDIIGFGLHVNKMFSQQKPDLTLVLID